MEGEEFNTEEYDAIKENGFASVVKSPLSTFGADVDTASYSNVRRLINMGYTPDEIPNGAVRTEEMVNYFSYSYNGPEDGEPFGVNAMISQCPWNEDNLLLHLGLQTEAVDFSQAGDSNIVFLIDVSGSMSDENKLPLLQQAFGLLIDELGEKDCVSIVTYASGEKVVIDGVSCDDKDQVLNALNGL
ncbi:MAG: von Willebrand factor type A domain-containing protein, partial [Acutalibacteraceae bacterium]|nr:von Willebrand factor type A domain-containing protein [Acutalibacteraceae bacterium]